MINLVNTVMGRNGEYVHTDLRDSLISDLARNIKDDKHSSNGGEVREESTRCNRAQAEILRQALLGASGESR